MNLARTGLRLLFLGASASLALAQGPARWEPVTDGFPTTATPAWTEIQSILCSDAVATVSGTGFEMSIDNATSPCPDDLLIYQFRNSSPALPFPREFWIEAVVSLDQSSNAQPDQGAVALHVRRNNTCGWVLEIDSDELFLSWNGQRIATHPIDARFPNRYRLVSDSTTELATVLVNGSVVLQDVPPGAPCITSGAFDTAAFFGHLHPGEPGISRWSEVRHNLAEGDGAICELFASTNSTGLRARISQLGSRDVAANDMQLRVDHLPPGSFGIFLVSTVPSSLPIISGPGYPLCLGGSVGRFVGPGQILQAGNAGTVQMPIDLTRLPQGAGFVAGAAGESWGFQYWYRDALPFQLGFSTAIDVLLL